MGGGELLIGRLDHPPRGDECRGVARVVGVRDVEGTAALGHLGEGRHCSFRIGRVVVDLHDEHRTGVTVEAEVAVVVEHAQACPVEEFEQARHPAVGHEVGDGLQSAALIREGRDRGERLGQGGHEAQRRLDDDAQGAFGADEEVTHIEPGHALGRLRAERGDGPVGQNDLE